MFKASSTFMGAVLAVVLSASAQAQAPAASQPPPAAAQPAAKPTVRVTVVEVAPPAHKLAAALADVLAARTDVGVMVEPEKAQSWFALCVDDETDRCFTNVCKTHGIDLVLRAWASSAGNKLSVSIDFVRPHEHGLQTFEETGVDASNPEAVHACAVRAVEKVLGKPSPTPTTPPIVLAPTPDKPEVTPASTSPGGAEATAGVTQTAPSGPSGLRVASYVTAGVGAAALVLGVVEGINVKAQNETLGNLAGTAPGQVPDQLASAKTSATIANIGMIAGGAAIAAGVVMFFLSPSEAPTAVPSVAVVNGGPTLALTGKF